MISVSGIRGIFGTDLTPINLSEFTAAYGTWTGGGKVVVGRDSRFTGQICEDIVCATLQSTGCEVVRLGIVPTPTVAMAVLHHRAQGGIIISASHNPAEWNALKLLNDKSEFLDKSQGEKVIQIAKDRSYTFSNWDKIGGVSDDENAIKRHIDEILNLPYINRELIASKHFKVAADTVNGAGSHALPMLFNALGVSYSMLFDEPNGIFPHNPEPLPEHLGEICEKIAGDSFDIGFVVDPDADRLAVVDDQGKLWGEEYTLSAAMELVLSKKKGDICVNLSSSRINDDIAEKHGVICHRSAVGEINVVKQMQASSCVIGGEGNGGVINPDLHYGRDALAGIAMILQFLAENGLSASAYRKSLKHYVIVKRKISLGDINADEVLEKAATSYKSLSPSTIDGVKIEFEEGWIHLRKSNTEPIVRVYCEAETEVMALDIIYKVTKEIGVQA